MRDDYHVFLVATLVFTRMLLVEIYHLVELPFDWLIDDAMFVCLVDELIPGICYSDFEMGDRWIWIRIDHLTLALQANRLTKCASHFVSW